MAPVSTVVKNAISDLAKISDGERLREALLSLKSYLGTGENSAQTQETTEFNRNHYTPVLEFLVAQIGPQWLDLLTSERLELWDSFFLEGPPDQAFLVLMDSLGKTGPSIRLDRCVHVLERFLQRGALAEVIWEVCQQQLESNPTSVLHEAILGRISSLPDHLANCLQQHNKPLFYPKNYYPRLAGSIIRVLQMVSDALRDGKNCSISFASQVVGKVCMQGRQKELLSVLVPRLKSLVQSDCIWQRICWRLLESVPDRWMEPVLTGIVQTAPGAEVLSQLLGDLVVKNKRTQFLLTKKMLFLQYGLKKDALQSILGYLSLDASRRHLLVKVLRELLEVWSSGSVVKHSPHPQLLHVSRCLLICLGLLNKQEIESCKQDLLVSLTSGARNYLDSSVPTTRRMGMVVAECLSHHIDTEGPGLSFQYEEDEDTRDLKALLKPPHMVETDSADFVKRPVESSPSKSPLSSPEVREKSKVKVKADQASDSDLDSDDDLVPYDMSADTELKKSKAPAYIRDCIEVLLSDDVEKLEVTMASLATLIQANTLATKEVSMELAKILLHIDEKPSVARFTELRHAALVAVTVTDPVTVSQYLTSEFYSLNYSLRQRMDILDVLSSAAQSLSEKPSHETSAESGSVNTDPHSIRSTAWTSSEVPVNWRKVVEERIASKTRRFAKGHSAATPVPAPNRYHAVAGHFFFPLIQNYDRQIVTFDLLGEDRLVLGRMVHTLGILMHLTLNAPIASQMGKALLEFVWVLRSHTDAFVRQGLLFCISTVLLSVPWEHLMTDMAEEVVETQCWLAEVAERDSDDDCRRLALNGLFLMEKLRSNIQGNP
ncbi:telomere length regulation protein TEL2 homolog [Xenopus tropicalis]|uniref:Telomere length regulation protein TEL2 homolog n=1 Tax=Xenopus tropicalis TaxID=8364 RepID=TELO2_XENTR|eukprot:NP_001072876.1 telomere length regulation protein TEL2 homolog [Xenopus tropicalis]